MPSVIADAIARGHRSVVPVAQITVDGHGRFSTAALTVVSDGDAVVQWLDASVDGASATARGQVGPIGAPGAMLELRLCDEMPILCRRVEIHQDDGALRVDLEGRSRRARSVVVDGVPRGLRVVDAEDQP